MTLRRKLTGGRAWAARLLVLLPVLALVGLALAVLPATAANPSSSPESGQGIQPLEVDKAGPDPVPVCDLAEAVLGLDPETVSAYAFDNNPTDLDVLLITDAAGDPVVGWTVKIFQPGDISGNEDYGSKSMEFQVLDGAEVVIADQGLESARKVARKQENLSLSFWCFSLVDGDPNLVSVSVDGSKKTNLYGYLLDCGASTGVESAGEFVAEFTLLDTAGCVPKSVFFNVDASGVEFTPPGAVGDNFYVGTITRPPEAPGIPHTALQISIDGITFVDIQWAVPGSVIRDLDGNITGFECPAPLPNHPDGWCALAETTTSVAGGVQSVYIVGGEGIDPFYK